MLVSYRQTAHIHHMAVSLGRGFAMSGALGLWCSSQANEQATHTGSTGHRSTSRSEDETPAFLSD